MTPGRQSEGPSVRNGGLLLRAVRAFLATEASGGIVLLIATVAALLWSNSPWRDAYEDVWHQTLALGAGSARISLDLRGWINEGLMAVFFFVVGLEIKRELVHGELSSARSALLPGVAAAGGMILPALLFLSLNAGSESARGWGIPMATDIAFAVGALTLFGRGLPSSVRLFLLSLAIADDVGAIAIIAIFYSGGFHSTLVGVALGLMTPARATERLERVLHPWTSYAIVPLFALANAGVHVTGGSLRAALTSRLGLGIVVGLVAGKLVGVGGATWIAVRLGLAQRPDGATWRDVAGVSAIAGIGFTISLFIADLAFDDAGTVAQAKVAILAGSSLAALLGGLILRGNASKDPKRLERVALPPRQRA
jgi:Na+:H+ antiporter, NhaA family